MSENPINPLRQRMIEDMTAGRFGEDTQRNYVRAVKNFAVYLGCSPDKASSQQAAASMQLANQIADQVPATHPALEEDYRRRKAIDMVIGERLA
jgi:hypothetical protein